MPDLNPCSLSPPIALGMQSMKTLKKVLYASGSGCLALAMLTCSANADVITLYEDASDFANISEVRTDDTNGTFVVENITNSAIGDGDALRLFDGSDQGKPQAYWDFTSTDALRLDLSAAVANPDPMNTNDINLRFGNNDTARPDSQSRAWVTFSFEQVGRLRSGGTFVAEIDDPIDISFVANFNQTDPLIYTLFGETRTLNPLSMKNKKRA